MAGTCSRVAIATQWHAESEQRGAQWRQGPRGHWTAVVGYTRHAFYSFIDRHQRSIVDWPLTSSPLGRVRIDSSRLSFPFSETMAAIARLDNWMTIHRFALSGPDSTESDSVVTSCVFPHVSVAFRGPLRGLRGSAHTQFARGYAVIRLYRNNTLLLRVNCLFSKRVSRSTGVTPW